MNFIINPFTKEKININNKTAVNLIKLYLKQYKSGGKYNKLSCPLCFKSIDIKQSGGGIRESMDCNHLFHKSCLEKYGENKACPTCNMLTLYGDYSK